MKESIDPTINQRLKLFLLCFLLVTFLSHERKVTRVLRVLRVLRVPRVLSPNTFYPGFGIGWLRRYA